ncbi:MAG: tRNA delta(2)-isopentenylpyrophosphate transferase [Francisellaceae bacterium]|nr:tRNA delta(2)-isopentenylpyrophosphate transferase [Francisellaceae bacterium]
MNKHPIFFLMGATASGKTQLSLQLSNNLPIEIINVDSTLVYKGLDIGTGKPTREELERLPHHLIDIRDPSDPYNVGDFCKDALALIPQIISRGNIPLLVGGTMLYFKALQEGLSDLPKSNPEIRIKLSEEAEVKGWEAMHERLNQIDPELAIKFHINDKQRIQRALEIYELTHIKPSEYFKLSKKNCPYPCQVIALGTLNKPLLHLRIKERLDGMLEKGFIDEVKVLFNRGDLNLDLPAIRSVGYRQVWGYLAKQSTYEEMVQKSIYATQQLAKRQNTWLNSWKIDLKLEMQHTDNLLRLQTYIKKIGLSIQIKASPW